MIRNCKHCGKPFEAKGTAKYCPGPHFSVCSVCGEIFEIDPKQPNATCSRHCASILAARAASTKTRVCELCGELFVPNNNSQRYCKRQHYRPCPICGTPVSFTEASDKSRTCSKECANKLRENTCMDVLGVPIASMAESVRDKLRESAIAAAPQKEATCIKNWGVSNAAKAEPVRRKISDTINSEECKLRTQATNLSRHGVRFSMQSTELHAKQMRSSKKHNQLEQRVVNIFTNYNIEFVSQYHMSSEDSSRIFDFYLPKYNMFIECDGSYWHSYLDDPDGVRTIEDYDYLRLLALPPDSIFIAILEDQFERGIKQVVDAIHKIDAGIFNQDSEIFSWCRSVGFPYYQYSTERLTKEYAKLCRLDVRRYNPKCKIGISAIRQHHRSIYDASVGNNPSPRQAWEDDDLLKKCIMNRHIYQNEVNPARVLEGFNVSKIAPKVSVFNPVFARYLTLKYLNNYNEVFDPFSGFSGRLLGVTSAGKHYIGRDIDPRHVEESCQLMSELDIVADMRQQDILSSHPADYDCLLTCPPYGAKETYGEEAVFHSCDEWIDMCISKFKCNRYVFVVDYTEKYAQHIVESVRNSSHFSSSSEYIVVIDL